ncbi:SCO4225 family membrane protein [Streptomyces sp. NPDC002851]
MGRAGGDRTPGVAHPHGPWAAAGERGGGHTASRTGVPALLLALPTGAVLLAVVNSFGAWAQTGTAAVCIALVSYVFQALLLGLLLQAIRYRGSDDAAGVSRMEKTGRSQTPGQGT